MTKKKKKLPSEFNDMFDFIEIFAQNNLAYVKIIFDNLSNNSNDLFVSVFPALNDDVRFITLIWNQDIVEHVL